MTRRKKIVLIVIIALITLIVVSRPTDDRGPDTGRAVTTDSGQFIIGAGDLSDPKRETES